MALVFASALVAFFFFDLGQYLNLDFFNAQKQALFELYEQQPVMVMAAYLAIYITVTAFSLPGAAIMTLAGGAVFGFWIGTVLVSFASTIGATLAFLLARLIARDWVQSRFGDQLGAINSGIEKDGSFYLFTLRLVPAIPFFVVNLLMALTPISTRAFFFVSQLGMLAGTMVYVNAGKQLATIDSVGSILSPAIIASFVLLASFPFIARAIMRRTGLLSSEG